MNTEPQEPKDIKEEHGEEEMDKIHFLKEAIAALCISLIVLEAIIFFPFRVIGFLFVFAHIHFEKGTEDWRTFVRWCMKQLS